MALNSFPTVGETTSINNRAYRATESGTYAVDVKPGVYRVTRQAITNILLGGQTITPSTIPTMIFITEPQNSITFNSTVSQNQTPWVAKGNFNEAIQPNWIYYDSILGFYILNHRSNVNTTAISSDGVSWVRRDILVSETYFNAWHQILRVRPDYIFSPGGWSLERTSFVIINTTDGRNWGKLKPGNQPGWNYAICIAVDDPTSMNPRVVIGGYASGTTGSLASSNNSFTAASWTYHGLLASEDFTTGTYGAGKFVFCGGSGSLRISTNGTTWTAGNPGFGSQRIAQVVFAQNTFVAVGNTGIITRSTDGVTWESSTSGFATNISITNLIYSEHENIFVAFARGNSQVRISTDAVTWQERTIPTNFENNGVISALGTYTYLQRINNDTFTVRQVDSMIITTPTVPFVDTYILLDFKGQIETLATEPEVFSVTNDGSGAYLIDGSPNAAITLVRGRSYIFNINASGHPFWVQTVSGAYSSSDVYNEGIVGNGSSVGQITWTVAGNAPNTLYYACQFHSSMQGTINIID